MFIWFELLKKDSNIAYTTVNGIERAIIFNILFSFTESTNKYEIFSENKNIIIVTKIVRIRKTIEKNLKYEYIFKYSLLSLELNKLGKIEDKLNGVPTWIVEVIRLIKVKNCEINPNPAGPKKTANNFTLITDTIKVIITEIESLYVTLNNFWISLI